MTRILKQAVLYGSSTCLAIVLDIVAFAIKAMARGFGSTKSSAPIVIAALLVWLLHAAYLLGPWFRHTNRQSKALWLMTPMAIVGITAAIVIASQLVPDNRANANAVFILCCSAWTDAIS